MALVFWQGLGISTSDSVQNEALQVSGVLARFTRQHQSRDVKVGDNPTARTLSFGKEIEEHAIQQGSVRVNNGMQQGIGELATHSWPLERKGNQGHRSEGRDVFKKTSYGNREFCAKFRAKGPQNSGIMGKQDSVGRNYGQIISKHPKFEEFWANTGILGKRYSRTECTRQHHSTDVKVGDNYPAHTLRFGKETADQAIQQGNARVNNGIQQDIGELAAQTSPPS
ncbi:hypothetical protein R3P38DRAFT_3365808 [Favolaschia claudopus]|uniref:Uncharacterized protein n=1 Tax=Favolaschia claudopus TaxID=2862362 RepID=A0AAW0AEM6_9AGAR